MGSNVQMIVNCARRSLFVAAKLLEGIDPKVAARKPRFETSAGAVVVDTNHPVFVYGHLSLYPARVAGMFNVDVKGVECPAAWTDLFKAGAPCIDDVAGTLYPTLGEVGAKLATASEAVLVAMDSMDDAALLVPPSDERFRERFFTVGGTANFLLNNHVSLHLGQVSAWRRCFGLPSAM